MKNIGLATTLAAILATTAAIAPAQDKPQREQTEAQKQQEKSETPKLVMQVPKSAAKRDIDARECLKFDSNREVHACAEKYR